LVNTSGVHGNGNPMKMEIEIEMGVGNVMESTRLEWKYLISWGSQKIPVYC